MHLCECLRESIRADEGAEAQAGSTYQTRLLMREAGLGPRLCVTPKAEGQTAAPPTASVPQRDSKGPYGCLP